MTMDVPGAIVECGVFKGTSLARFAMFRELFGNTFSKKIIGFDIFNPDMSKIILEKDNNIAAAITIGNYFKKELEVQIEYFKKEKQHAQAQRIERRVKFDLEMMREMGYSA